MIIFSCCIRLALWQTCIIYFTTYTYWHINPVNLWDSTAGGYEAYSTTIVHLVSLVTNLEVKKQKKNISQFLTINYE